MLVVRWNCFLPTHNSPSSVSAGRSLTNHSGATKRFPNRLTKFSPSQYALIPSSFSLIHQLVGSWSVSHLCANRIGGLLADSPFPPRVVPPLGELELAPALEPIRAVSLASPKYARRCLHVRF